MNEYKITASEVVYYSAIIEAETEDEAVEKFNDKSPEEFQNMVSDIEGYEIESIESIGGTN